MSDDILSAWTDYENEKRMRWDDVRFFSCKRVWEVEYLVGKIHLYYPAYDNALIRMAIRSKCTATNGNHSRAEFVAAVMNELKRMR